MLMIQENQEQDLELAGEEIQEEVQEEKKPELTPEQRRGILKRQLTKLEKEMGVYKEEPKPEVKEVKEVKTELSAKDYLALSQQGVSADDFDEVQEYASFKKISIADALGSTYIKDTLKRRKEERETALAANTGGGQRGSQKIPDETILDRASREGDPDSEGEAVRLAEAHFNQKFGRKK